MARDAQGIASANGIDTVEGGDKESQVKEEPWSNTTI